MGLHRATAQPRQRSVGKIALPLTAEPLSPLARFSDLQYSPLRLRTTALPCMRRPPASERQTGRRGNDKGLSSVRCHCTCGVPGALGISAPARAEDANKTDLDALRQALSKYEDFKTAVRDLYLSTEGCVYYSGEKIESHMEYPKGAMGVHFVNVTVGGPPNAERPNVLIYEPTGDGMKLVAVEWLVPYVKGAPRPSLFGQEFQGPMEGHFPLIPKEFVHYDLHAWLKDNPNGMFTPTNPNVSCDKAEFPMLEQPTKMIME